VGAIRGVGFRDAAVERARELGVMGWVRHDDAEGLLVHAEGAAGPLAEFERFLATGPPGAEVEALELERVRAEGHEQFAIRGVPAGRFAVHERERGYDLQLEVGGAMRVWTVPKEPSLDPAAKRLAIELPAPGAAGEALVWDEGVYEQGGRVPWPDALDRGHAVFVLHGARLRGGFALQRTGGGAKPRWLLIKRRDEEARAGG
jgi:acylphosphatase